MSSLLKFIYVSLFNLLILVLFDFSFAFDYHLKPEWCPGLTYCQNGGKGARKEFDPNNPIFVEGNRSEICLDRLVQMCTNRKVILLLKFNFVYFFKKSI